MVPAGDHEGGADRVLRRVGLLHPEAERVQHLETDPPVLRRCDQRHGGGAVLLPDVRDAGSAEEGREPCGGVLG